jgi:hypothetical protein
MEPSTSLYPEPDQSSLHNPSLSLQDTSKCYQPTYVFFFLVVFSPLTYVFFLSPILNTCPAYHLLDYLMVLIILDEEYKLRSSSG